ncbi:MAG: pyridoxal phosphate-dependent aminotransferase [Candidatus Zixiibacteriota bacterium]|nr:MAG: pyridoxal phosphate-dependent aminotransferase [candidate division Zixibacteria bacterium]
MKYAERMKRLGTETAFEVLVRARELEAEGKDVVHLEIGEPDFDTPKYICDAAIKAIRDGYTHYNPAPGYPEIRKIIAEEISKTRGIKVNPEHVVITPGGKPIMFFTIFALVDEGDEVIYPNPGFPIYGSLINYVNAKAVPIPLREENDFRFDVKELKSLVTPRTKLLIINSPQNPTGGVLTHEDLQEIARIAVDNDLWVLADEIYSRIIYEADFESVTQFPGMQERTIILDGMSKTYAMTGWRLGYGIMNEKMAAAVARLQTNATSCTSAFSQMAIGAAITGPQDDSYEMVEQFRKRRDVIVEGLNNIEGVSCKKPLGAFYVFPNIKQLKITAKDFEELLLEEYGVAALAGTSFGSFGEGYLRFSYANSVENIKKALSRVDEAAAEILRKA